MTREGGDRLHESRVQQGRTLLEAASDLDVPPAALAALEGEEFGFSRDVARERVHLRMYAEYLGLDSEPMLEHYELARRAPVRDEDPANGELTPPTALRTLLARVGPFDLAAVLLGLVAATLVVAALG